FPHQVTAFMMDSVVSFEGACYSSGKPAVIAGRARGRRRMELFSFTHAASRAVASGLSVGSRDFSGFHELFEAAQVVVDLLLRLFAEERSEPASQAAGGGDVVQD